MEPLDKIVKTTWKNLYLKKETFEKLKMLGGKRFKIEISVLNILIFRSNIFWKTKR